MVDSSIPEEPALASSYRKEGKKDHPQHSHEHSNDKQQKKQVVQPFHPTLISNVFFPTKKKRAWTSKPAKKNNTPRTPTASIVKVFSLSNPLRFHARVRVLPTTPFAKVLRPLGYLLGGGKGYETDHVSIQTKRVNVHPMTRPRVRKQNLPRQENTKKQTNKIR